MHYPFRFFAILTLGILFISHPLSAQKRKKTSRQVDERTSVMEAEELFRSYRFTEASEVYNKEIEVMRRQRKSTALLEAALAKVRMGENMLRATEDVVFVDSLVVPASEILPSLHLSKECGSVISTSQIVGSELSSRSGIMGFLNELGDRAILALSDTSGRKRLYVLDQIGAQWSNPRPLNIGKGNDDSQDYPFMMPDGVTLYYAAQGSESLGGYDIFVTRYNAESGTYVRPENMGMPFNSPANDYLYVVDETTGVGLFVTDRNQPADSVCIYRFIPGDVRRLCTSLGYTDEELRCAALINSITPKGKEQRSMVQNARARLAAARNSDENTTGEQRFVIDNQTVYTSLSQFRHQRARQIAQEWVKESAKLSALEREIENMRDQYFKSKSAALSHKILNAERLRDVLLDRVKMLAKNMRNAEIGNASVGK